MILGLAVAGFIIVASLGKGKKGRKRGEEIRPPIKYRIAKGGRQADGISMEVVVDPETKKQQAIDLGYFLKEKYREGNTKISIGIFNDIRCALGRLNKSIPREIFFQHYLVQITVDRSKNQDSVEWCKQ
jgi:hypothetical protein